MNNTNTFYWHIQKQVLTLMCFVSSIAHIVFRINEYGYKMVIAETTLFSFRNWQKIQIKTKSHIDEDHTTIFEKNRTINFNIGHYP